MFDADPCSLCLSVVRSLGIHEIVITSAHRVEKGYFGSKYLDKERFTKGLMAGLVQAKDTHLPLFRVEKDLKSFVSQIPSDSLRIVAHPGEDLPRINELFDRIMSSEESKEQSSVLPTDDSIDNKVDGQHQEDDIDDTITERPFKKIFLMIGPEGGWIDGELDTFKQNGFTMCSIGKRILRTDVATISLISILRNEVEQYLGIR